MALAATATSTRKVVAPSSPFAELLRRSKFASYDPAIRQTYQAAPSNAHRGDWGVKRPISLRRKNAFMSLTSFEHHAHFTDWDHAENQVRFIRRIEEMGGRVTAKQGTPWRNALGKARTNPPFDSDYCPGETADLFLLPKRVQTQTETKETEEVDLSALGNRGSGQYGARREPLIYDEVFATANIQAMSKRQFRRYVRSLRALRPEFQEFVNSREEIPEKNLHALAQGGNNRHYRRFLQAQMKKGYDDFDSLRIEPQPHPNAALSYTSLTQVESLLWTKAKKGFLLHGDSHPKLSNPNANNKNAYIASFGGVTVSVNSATATGKDLLLGLDTEEGVKLEDIDNSVIDLRVDPVQGIKVEIPPTVVGNRPRGLKSASIDVQALKDDEGLGWDNPHPLGSMEYISMTPITKKSIVRSFNQNQLPTRPQITPSFAGRDDLIATIRNMTRGAKKRGDL